MATTDPAPAKGVSRKKLIILIVVGLLVLAGAGVGVTLWLKHGKEAKAAADKENATASADGEQPAEGDAASAGAEEGGDEGKDAEDGKSKPASIYVELVPAFVVNFQDDKKRARFLKAEISILVKTSEAEEALKANRPAIRNSLVMLLSKQVYEQLLTPEGKEKLRADALVEVKAVVGKLADARKAKQVQDVFFSSLVMQ